MLANLLEHATVVHGSPARGFFTFEIPGDKPINFVLYLTYGGQYQAPPLYSDDVVVRIPKGAKSLQFYKHSYTFSDAATYRDMPIEDLHEVAQTIRCQAIHPDRFDPAGILRVIRDITYYPEKESCNQEGLKKAVERMLGNPRQSSSYQNTLLEFIKGPHKIAPEYLNDFLANLAKYGLPQFNEPQDKVSSAHAGRASFFQKPSYFGYAHLIELLLADWRTANSVERCIRIASERLCGARQQSEVQTLST